MSDDQSRPLFKDAFSEQGAELLESLLRELLPHQDFASALSGLARHLRAQFPDLELMDRSRAVTNALIPVLPNNPHAALATVQTLAERWPDSSGTDTARDLIGFWRMAFLDCVPALWQRNPTEELMSACLDTLRSMTRSFSAEFAVRPFLIASQDAVLRELSSWTTDADPAVRRLVSEGTRPRLPWGVRLPALIAEPSPLLPLLELLKDDPDEAVRRSVANNLNDISRDHPDVAAHVLTRWYGEADALPADAADNRRKLVRHAARTLHKQGHAGALALFGYHAEVPVTVSAAAAEPVVVPWEGEVLWSCELLNNGPEAVSLMLDYRVELMGANGNNPTSRNPTGRRAHPAARRRSKTLKGSRLDLQGGERRAVRYRFSFKPVTTRRYYPGPHAVELMLNGVVRARVEFTLEPAATTDDPA